MSQDRQQLACKKSAGKVGFDYGEAIDDLQMLCSRRKRVSASTVEECDKDLSLVTS